MNNILHLDALILRMQVTKTIKDPCQLEDLVRPVSSPFHLRSAARWPGLAERLVRAPWGLQARHGERFPRGWNAGGSGWTGASPWCFAGGGGCALGQRGGLCGAEQLG